MSFLNVPEGARSIGLWPLNFPIPDLLDSSINSEAAAELRKCIENPSLKTDYLKSNRGLKSYILTRVTQAIWSYTPYPNS